MGQRIANSTLVADRLGWLLALGLLFAMFMAIPGQASAEPVAEQPGFYVEEVFGGYEPESSITAVRFAPEPDDRAFVAERRGRILVFEELDDPTPAGVIDLTEKVHGWWDRGLLGLAVDPDFANDPWIYVFYTVDTGVDWQGAPWGGPGLDDGCPDPPGATTDGCVVEGRLSRMQINPDNSAGPEEILLEGKWCFQFPSHSADDLVFGEDGMLYLSAGDGANFGAVDYGQYGGTEGSPVPENPCEDPPFPSAPTTTNGEGGMLRSQDIRTSGDDLGYNGSILRIDPVTGHAAEGNPEYDPALTPENQPAEARMIATGLRNPYRMAFGPDGDLYVGDVGWSIWEEINVIEGATDGNDEIVNFGWPCYEGREDRNNAVEDLGNDICMALYADEDADDDTVTEPLFEYRHDQPVWPGAEGSGHTGGSAISSIAFMDSDNSNYPQEWDGALLFSDYNRAGVWALQRDAGGYVEVQGVGGASDVPKDGYYLVSSAGVVDIQPGPEGDLYLVELDGGVYRLGYDPNNVPPTAQISRQGLEGDPPREVMLDASTSADADGDDLQFDWDLDGDGYFNDASGETVSHYFDKRVRIGVKVSDEDDRFDIDRVVVLPPHPGIEQISPSRNWRVGDTIEVTGIPRPGAGEPDEYVWQFNLHHCAPNDPNDCHVHPQTSMSGGTASFPTVNHGYPSYLEAVLTAIYPDRVQGVASLRLDPATSQLTVLSPDVPVPVSIGENVVTSPVTRKAIENGAITISVPETVEHGGHLWTFDRWSDGGPRVRDLTVPISDVTYIARYNAGRAPVISAIPDTTVEAGSNLREAVKASDPDGDGISFALTKAPSTATINPSGVIRWTPGSPHVGKTFQFRVKATDDWSTPQSASETFNVRVVAPQTPPTPQPPPTTPPPTTQPPPATEPPTTVPDGSTFADTAGSVHEADIELLAASGITFGCNPPENTLFCPEDGVTRAQMASFLVRGLNLAPADAGRFSDTGGSVHEPDINALAAAQITLGCNPPDNDLYCPDDVVTRAQMASFLVRGLHLAASDGGKFDDVANSVHEADINALAAAGVTLGCNPPENNLYCPEDQVTRAQMASFLVRGIPLPRP